jgi:hypothetical protein
MVFITVVLSLLGVFGALLWFTGWAERRVVAPESEPVEAKSR